MTALTALPAATKKVLVDPHPFWGGWVVAIIAGVIFLAFSVWIILQRVQGERVQGKGDGTAKAGRGQGGSDD